MNLEFYFNEWAFLASIDPDAFERCREQYINEFLRQSGRHRQRLEALQSGIDGARKLSTTPEEAVIRISFLMCKSYCDLMSEMNSLSIGLKNLKAELPRENGADDQTTEPTSQSRQILS